MTTAFVQLGKIGDVLNSIPIAQAHHRETGEKPHFVISKQYASILDRIPNVIPAIFDGEWDNLAGAIKWAKRQFDNVIVTQTYGKDMPIEHRCSSWQLDAYERAGRLHQFDTLPLEVSTNGNLAIFEAPTILLCDHSQSSPFFQAEDLHRLLEERFPLHEIKRASDFRLKNFCEFVPIFRSVEAIVCVESAHLHLTRATKTPVVALAADLPSKWNGSAWSKRYAFYCRYSEYEERKEELVERLDAAMNGVKKKEAVRL